MTHYHRITTKDVVRANVIAALRGVPVDVFTGSDGKPVYVVTFLDTNDD